MVHIWKSSIRRILSEHLQMRRICSTWVPHFLICEQMEHRVEMVKKWVQRVRRDSNFLSKVIACDETWAHYLNPKSKRESEVSRTSSSPKTKKIWQQKSAGMVKLCVFFEAQGVIYQHINKKRSEIVLLWILH